MFYKYDITIFRDCFNSGYEYSTLATFRFSILAYHNLINGAGVGKECWVTALSAGACNIRPKQQRYTFILDVKKVNGFLTI